LPFLYLPADYYKVLADEINGLHGGTVCDTKTNRCKFDTSCDKVSQKAIQFEFRLYDAAESFFYQIDYEELYVSGSHFGDTDDTCYIPVFDHGQTGEAGTNLVMVGNIFM